MPKTPVFVSWSGDRSKAVAVALCDWFRKVLQTAEPWCSPEIPAGDRWSSVVAERLHKSSIGIIVVTRENRAMPWLLFEAGALSGTIERGKVIPYFVGLNPTDIEGPLTQFQGKVADKDGTFDVVKAIHAALPADDRLGEADQRAVFDSWWPTLKERLDAVLPRVSEGEAPPKPHILSGFETERATILVGKKDRDRDPWKGPRIGYSDMLGLFHLTGRLARLGAPQPDVFPSEAVPWERLQCSPVIILGGPIVHSGRLLADLWGRLPAQFVLGPDADDNRSVKVVGGELHHCGLSPDRKECVLDYALVARLLGVFSAARRPVLVVAGRLGWGTQAAAAAIGDEVASAEHFGRVGPDAYASLVRVEVQPHGARMGRAVARWVAPASDGVHIWSRLKDVSADIRSKSTEPTRRQRR